MHRRTASTSPAPSARTAPAANPAPTHPAAPRRAATRPAAALAAALLAAALAVTGCTDSGSDDGGGSGKHAAAVPNEGGRAQQQDEGGAVADQGTGSGRGTAGDAAERVSLAPQALIRTAEVSIRTKDIEADADAARTLAENAGGYVGNETTTDATRGVQSSRLTLRVPAEEYAAVLDDVTRLGDKVTNRQVRVKDVTDEVVDVDSRVKSQRASVDRIRRLMNDATKLGDVVTLESELGTRQADLEALLARQSSLEERTSLGTITVELNRPPAAPKKSEEDDDTTVGDALAGGWDAFVTGVLGVVIAVSAALPFLAALALLILAWRLLRRYAPRLPKRHVTPPPSPFGGQPAAAPQGSEEP